MATQTQERTGETGRRLKQGSAGVRRELDERLETYRDVVAAAGYRAAIYSRYLVITGKEASH